MTNTPLLDMAKILLNDVRVGRIKFNPGDRIIVKTTTPLNADQHRKLERSVCKFAGCDVRVLIVNCLEAHLTLHRGDETYNLSDPDSAVDAPELGVVNVDCNIVNLLPGDRLFVSFNKGMKIREVPKTFQGCLERWAGKDVPVLVY